MIEIFSIILQFLIFITLFSYPYCLYKDKVFLLAKSFAISGIYLRTSINILIHINLLLILSFFNINKELYFYFIIFLSIFSNIIFYFNKAKFETNFNDLLFFSIFIIICLGIFFKTSTNLKLEWDGLNHWFPKALNFYSEVNIQNLKNLGFSEYPHLGTYIWGFFLEKFIFRI